MSYGRDPDRRHRGVGAIASIDGVGNRRRRAQARKMVAMNVIDARHAQLAHGPRRALPVSLGRTNLPETDTGSGGSGGGGGGWTAPTRTPVMSSTQLSTNLATATPIAPVKAVSPLSTSIATSLPTTYATPLPTYPTVVIDPAPTSTTPTTPTGGGGRAPYVPKSGSGGSTFTMPGQPVPTFQPPSEVEDLPPPSSGGGQVSGKTLALVGGGIALLWLLTRKQE
jgi:hypothetical protein